MGVVATFLALPLVNAAYPGYLDHAEPNIASVSWLVLQGQPLYHAITSPSRYTLLYGPSCYLPYVAGLWLGGGHLLSLRCVVVAANFTIAYCLWRTYRSILGGFASLLVLAVVLAFLYVPRPNHYLLQIRSDVLMLAAVALGLYATSLRTAVGALVLGLASAFVLDTKIIAFIYVVPLLLIFASRAGWRLTWAAAFWALGASALPFLLPNVSLLAYLDWVHRATGHPTAVADLLATLRTLPIFVVPLLLLAGPLPWQNGRAMEYLQKNRFRFLALLGCMACAVATSSRIGAGSHYMLPFVPVLGYEYALLYKATGASVADRWPLAFRYACAGVALVGAVRIAGGLEELVRWNWSHWREAAETEAYVHEILRKCRGNAVQMGYGNVEAPATFFRSEVVFATNRLVVDDEALCDMDLDGIKLPASTVDLITRCSNDVWLIPAGQEPFSTTNTFFLLYPDVVPPRPLFGSEVASAFVRRHHKKESVGPYDLWVCDGAECAADPAPAY